MATDNEQLTYAEYVGAALFNWHEFLDNAPKDYDDERWQKAQSLSAQWVSCACGNQCAVLPRAEDDGEPADSNLAALGFVFYRLIRDREVLSAKVCLAQIEQRSAYLLTCPNYTAPDGQ